MVVSKIFTFPLILHQCRFRILEQKTIYETLESQDVLLNFPAN